MHIFIKSSNSNAILAYKIKNLRISPLRMNKKLSL